MAPFTTLSLGAAAMMLLTVFDGNQKLREIELENETVTIGRDPGNHLILPDHSVSRRHAQIEPNDSFFLIRDSWSAGGTFVNNRLARLEILHHGDTIRVGRYYLRISDPLLVPGPRKPAPGSAPGGRPADRSQELRELMLAVAHRLRSTLTPIEANLPLLRPLAAEDSAEQAVLGGIEQSLRQLCELVDQFSEFAELEVQAARSRGSFTAASANNLVRRAVGAVGEAARARRIMITDHLPEGMPTVLADAERLTRALIHLLGALIKSSADGAILTLEGKEEGGTLQLNFSTDSGGLPPAEVDPSSAAAPTVEGAGTAGLSLAIARHILREHGGDLQAGPPARGKGGATLWKVLLPAPPPLEPMVVGADGSAEKRGPAA